MDYGEATRYLISLGNEVRASGSDSVHVAKLSLENITALLSELGHPEKAYPSVLIAGTNGKGSVAAMLDAVLRAAGNRERAEGNREQGTGNRKQEEGNREQVIGNSNQATPPPTVPCSLFPVPCDFRAGLYTSPHLVEINERIQLAGIPIPEEEFAGLFTFLHERIEKLLATGRLKFHPTYFECLTAMAMEYFRRKNCSLAVLEVGMGGRLDATNTATPRIAIITEIDFDHERFLGRTISAIAGEKAGIIKRGIVVISAASRPEAAAVIREKALEQGARLVEVHEEYRAEDVSARDGQYSFEVRHEDGFRLSVSLALRGRHQVENSLAVVAAARELERMGFPVSEKNMRRGLASAEWPGRLELLREKPSVYLDGAHNPAGARALARFWEENFPGAGSGQSSSRKLILVYGAMRDKAVPEIAEILFPLVSAVILTRPEQFRSAAPETIRELAGHLNGTILCESEPEAALDAAMAMAGPEDAIFVTGSLYLVGDVKRRWAGRELESQLRKSLPVPA